MSPSCNTVYGWDGQQLRDGTLVATRHLIAAPDRHAAQLHPETPRDPALLRPTSDPAEIRTALGCPHQHLWRYADQPDSWISHGGAVPSRLGLDQPRQSVPPQTD